MRSPYRQPALFLLLIFACTAPFGACFAARPLAAAPATVEAAQGAANLQSPFLLLYPELRNAPAPPWLKPGMRLTYNFAYATFAREFDDPTPAGGGMVQFDVVAQDPRNVVGQTTMFSPQLQGQPPTVLGGAVSLPGVGEYWFAPQVLAHAEDAASPQFAVNRLTTEVEGETYDVVRMQTTGETNRKRSEEVWEFDAKTGVLVFYRQALYGVDGEQESGHIMTLVSMRQIKLPWRFGSVPPWVKRGIQLDFAGTQLLDLGGPPYVPLPMAVSLRIDKVGTLWSEYTQNSLLNGRQLGKSAGVTGSAQIFGGLWLPPEALGAGRAGVLKAGDVLDRDRQTGVVTRVDEANSRRIAVSAEGPGYLTRYLYNARDGRLAGYYQEAHMAAGVQYTELAAR